MWFRKIVTKYWKCLWQLRCKITKSSAEIKGCYSVLGTFTSVTVSNWQGLPCSRTNTACNCSSLKRQFSLHHPLWIMIRMQVSPQKKHPVGPYWLFRKSLSFGPDNGAGLYSSGCKQCWLKSVLWKSICWCMYLFWLKLLVQLIN